MLDRIRQILATVALEFIGFVMLDGASITCGDVTLTRIGDNMIVSVPTEDPAVSGAIWNDNGTLKVSSGESS